MSNEQKRLERERMLERIKQNIQESGYRLYIVKGGVVPRYAYTIGLREALGAELILGGAIYFMMAD